MSEVNSTISANSNRKGKLKQILLDRMLTQKRKHTVEVDQPAAQITEVGKTTTTSLLDQDDFKLFSLPNSNYYFAAGPR